LSVAGVLCFLSLKLALFPDITFPVVIVTARSEAIDPAANERAVTDPLEAALGAIPGVSRMHSLTYPKFAVVDLSFDVGTSLDTRAQQVRDVLRSLHLPPGTSLEVSPQNFNETAVTTYAVYAEGRSLSDLANVAEHQIAPSLRALPGVLKVAIVGGTQTGTNASAYRYDGRPAIGVNVVKRADANALDVAEASDDTVDALRAKLTGLTLTRATSQAVYIRDATRATEEALALAIVLAILVIWPFLGDARATMISALAIPVSLLGTAVVMRILHFHLETITLLALSLVVGVILDDAIVAVENIVRHIEAGTPPREAAFDANKEIGLTLVAASLTIVAVFLPIGLMRGTLGQFFRPFGLTASAAVLFSLLAARTLSPSLAALWLRPRKDPSEEVDPNRTGRASRYRHVLDWALGHRALVVSVAIATVIAGLALIPFIPKGFIPHLDRGEFLVTFQTPLGTELSDTIAVAEKLEHSVKSNPNAASIFTTIGSRPGQSNVGVLDVYLKPSRDAKTIDVENAVRAALPSLDGVQTTVGDVPFVGSDTAKPLQFALLGADLDSLRSAALRFVHQLRGISGFADVTATGLSDGTPFSAIEHVNGHRAVQITADLSQNLMVGDADDRVAVEARATLPPAIVLDFGGTSADAVTTFRDFGIALTLSIVAIVVVLLLLFRTWADPLVISVGLPLSVSGALFALWITRSQFGLISLMGLIFLFGLVNKNAILLVDRIERLRGLGLERAEAIREAGAQRLRPIVMTSAATILGMLPIALGFGAGAELRAPMATAIIGGLITSTLLSLIVVPVAYTLVDDLRQRFRRT
jgi:multidrug efflux pump subunit AcrB